MKGVCLKVGITKPKKPNSGERKTARVRLSNGKSITAYIMGEGESEIPTLLVGEADGASGSKVMGAQECVVVWARIKGEEDDGEMRILKIMIVLYIVC